MRSSHAPELPDLELLFVPSLFINEGLSIPKAHGLTLGAVLLQPLSRGSVSINSPDPDGRARDRSRVPLGPRRSRREPTSARGSSSASTSPRRRAWRRRSPSSSNRRARSTTRPSSDRCGSSPRRSTTRSGRVAWASDADSVVDSAPPGPRRRATAGRRCLGDPTHHPRPHPCADRAGRRASGRPDPLLRRCERAGLACAGAVLQRASRGDPASWYLPDEGRLPVHRPPDRRDRRRRRHRALHHGRPGRRLLLDGGRRDRRRNPRLRRRRRRLGRDDGHPDRDRDHEGARPRRLPDLPEDAEDPPRRRDRRAGALDHDRRPAATALRPGTDRGGGRQTGRARRRRHLDRGVDQGSARASPPRRGDTGRDRSGA